MCLSLSAGNILAAEQDNRFQGVKWCARLVAFLGGLDDFEGGVRASAVDENLTELDSRIQVIGIKLDHAAQIIEDGSCPVPGSLIDPGQGAPDVGSVSFVLCCL